MKPPAPGVPVVVVLLLCALSLVGGIVAGVVVATPVGSAPRSVMVTPYVQPTGDAAARTAVP